MGVKLVSTSGGSVSINPPTTASNFTATMPARTGGVMVDGPAFSAYSSGTFNVANSTATKLPANTEVFDTNSNYDTINYRFTPTVAGYYQVSSCVASTGAYTAFTSLKIYKNGATYQQIGFTASVANYACPAGSALVYLNGSTDYIEMYVTQNSGSTQTFNASNELSFFSAVLVRGA
jgi:hypothetical protein